MSVAASGSQTRLAYVALAAAGALWGSSFLLGKIALRDMGPAYLVLYRFVLACIVLIPFVPRNRARLNSRDLGLLVLGALLMGPLMFLLQFEGLDRTTASSAALLVGTIPPMLAIGGFIVDRERTGRMTWLAIVCAVIGVALLVGGPGEGRTLLGDSLVFLSMVASVAWTLLVRRIARRLGVITTTAFLFAMGTLILLPFAIALEGAPPLLLPMSAVASVVGLGVGCTALTFWLWNWGFQRSEAARAGVFANLEPLVGVTLGVTLLDEHLGSLAVVGGLLVIGAALLVSLGKT